MPYATLDDLIEHASEAEIRQIADRDRDGVIDPSGTDLDVHWRTGAWYRRRLARGFTEIGGGLWLSHRSTAPMFELERAR